MNIAVRKMVSLSRRFIFKFVSKQETARAVLRDPGRRGLVEGLLPEGRRLPREDFGNHERRRRGQLLPLFFHFVPFLAVERILAPRKKSEQKKSYHKSPNENSPKLKIRA